MSILPLLLATLALAAQGHASCPPVRQCLSTLQSGQPCSNLLPVPSRALRTPIPSGTFTVTPIRPGVFEYFDGLYLSLILRSGSRLVMLDLINTPASSKPDGSRTRTTDAAELVLNGTTPTDIDIVYSHAHFDHIGATTRFVTFMRAKFPKASIRIWGTEEADRLTRVSTTGLAPRPTVIVPQQGLVLRLSNTLQVIMRPVGGHTQQDLLLQIPQSRDGFGITMFVDIAFPRWAPPFEFAETQDLREYIAAHRAILDTRFGVYVGGHIRTGNRAEVEESMRYAQDVLQAAENAERDATLDVLLEAGIGDVIDSSSPAFGNEWFGFAVTRQVQVDMCYREIVRKWGCQLGGVDLFARGHCLVALQFLTIAN